MKNLDLEKWNRLAAGFRADTSRHDFAARSRASSAPSSQTASLCHFRRTSAAGFTLMEMILVLLIITSLMGMVIFKMSTNVDDANRTAAMGSIQALETTLLRYKMANGSLPTEQQGLEALTVPSPKLRQAFLKKDGINDPWGRVFQYRNPGRKSGGDFDVFSMGPDGQPDTADDIGNW